MLLHRILKGNLVFASPLVDALRDPPDFCCVVPLVGGGHVPPHLVQPIHIRAVLPHFGAEGLGRNVKIFFN